LTSFELLDSNIGIIYFFTTIAASSGEIASGSFFFYSFSNLFKKLFPAVLGLSFDFILIFVDAVVICLI